MKTVEVRAFGGPEQLVWTEAPTPRPRAREQEREHIRLAVKSIAETTGERPLGWYCRYGPSVNTRELVVEEGGFVYDADAYNDDLPYFTEVKGQRHLVVPYSLTYNDGRYILPQGFSSPTDFFDQCRRGLDELRKEGEAGYPKMMSIGLHSRFTGQPARADALARFIDAAQGMGDVWFARRLDIANTFREQYPYERARADGVLET